MAGTWITVGSGFVGVVGIDVGIDVVGDVVTEGVIALIVDVMVSQIVSFSPVGVRPGGVIDGN